MSTTEIEQAQTNQEAALRASADAEQARRLVLLWQKPHLSDQEIPDALGIPPSLWATLKANGEGPPLFQIGRRVFTKTADLRTWLDEQARDAQPGSKRLRGMSAAAAKRG
jgi:hypothetical protein